jgi:simple sugar transport system permease protein
VAIWFFLYRTRFGLKVRSVGESPRTADSLGTNVTLVRYAMTIVGTGIIALGGAYIPLVFTGTYTDTLISGRGWICILLALFGRWDPRLVMVGAISFAGVEVSALYAQVLGFPIPNQVLLMVPFLVTLVIMVEVYRHAEVPKGLGKNYDRESLED